MARWRVLRRASSEVRAGKVVEVVLTALVEGSSWMGRKEKESGVSIVRVAYIGQYLVGGCGVQSCGVLTMRCVCGMLGGPQSE